LAKFDFCYRYGFYPIAIERPRGKYIEAIRAWLYYRLIEPWNARRDPA
jgi:hypothetical protein